jgi:hypothetical protein
MTGSGSTTGCKFRGALSPERSFWQVLACELNAHGSFANGTIVTIHHEDIMTYLMPRTKHTDLGSGMSRYESTLGATFVESEAAEPHDDC